MRPSELYTETKDAILSANTKGEVVELFKKYDEVQGAKLRKGKLLEARIEELHVEQDKTEAEVHEIRKDITYRMVPMQSHAGERLLQLELGESTDENTIQAKP